MFHKVAFKEGHEKNKYFSGLVEKINVKFYYFTIDYNAKKIKTITIQLKKYFSMK